VVKPPNFIEKGDLMKLLLTAIALMMLSACGSDDNPVANNTTSDVVVEDAQEDVTDVASDVVDSTQDVATVEEGD
jgi:uncharacterized lipoprotein YajG